MGLDMYLTLNGERLAAINWLRNPFGLIRWVEDNTVKVDTKYSLYEVCNNWTYRDSNKIEREEFLKTVMAYRDQVACLTDGYFTFTLCEYRSFVEPNLCHMTYAKGSLFGRSLDGETYTSNGRLKLPMSQFKHVSGYNLTLDDYKKWYSSLVEFAEQLQDPDVEFYCSN